jgi:cytochrome oxidase assembly protein ShyY1
VFGGTAIIGDPGGGRMKRLVIGWSFALALAFCFSLLGRWQLHRAVEKQGMLDRVAAVLHGRQAQPLSALSRQPDLGYAWVAGTGRFADAPALLLDNQRRGDAVGVHVFRVFAPEQGQPLLVDLGWRPLPADRSLPVDVRAQGLLSVSGLLMPPPSAGLALGPPYVIRDPSRWLLTRIDLPALSAGLKTSLGPRVLRLDPALPLGYQRDLDVLPNTLPPQQHRAYAVQWFGLAIASLATALVLTLRRKK